MLRVHAHAEAVDDLARRRDRSRTRRSIADSARRSAASAPATAGLSLSGARLAVEVARIHHRRHARDGLDGARARLSGGGHGANGQGAARAPSAAATRTRRRARERNGTATSRGREGVDMARVPAASPAVTGARAPSGSPRRSRVTMSSAPSRPSSAVARLGSPSTPSPPRSPVPGRSRSVRTRRGSIASMSEVSARPAWRAQLVFPVAARSGGAGGTRRRSRGSTPRRHARATPVAAHSRSRRAATAFWSVWDAPWSPRKTMSRKPCSRKLRAADSSTFWKTRSGHRDRAGEAHVSGGRTRSALRHVGEHGRHQRSRRGRARSAPRAPSRARCACRGPCGARSARCRPSGR